MVILNKIYTKTGDDGSTALGTGERRPKHDLRISAYGTIDEANACIGIARLHVDSKNLNQTLARIQNDLFDLGADLATPDDGTELEYEPLRITDQQVAKLEAQIDLFNENLQPLRSFVLPGGSPASAHLHLARTIARRAERLMTDLKQQDNEIISPPAMKYINRLSDFLFVAARFCNDNGTADVLWVPGENR